MKNLRILVSTLLAFSLFSCQEGNDAPDNGNSEKVYLNVNVNIPATRADVSPVNAGYQSKIGSNSYLYVIDGIGKVVGEPVLFTPDEDAQMTIETTSEAETILLLANAPDGFVPDGYVTQDALQKSVFAMGLLAPAGSNGNGVEYATLYNTGNSRIDKGDWTVAVTIAPIVARIELLGVSGDAELTAAEKEAGFSEIKNFELAGVYLNNIYKEMTLTGAFPASGVLEGEITRIASDWSCDVLNESDPAIRFAPEQGAWAYHIAPVNGVVPQIVLMLKNIRFANEQTSDKLYVTINAYMDENEEEVVQFLPGNVYQIEHIRFNHSDLSTVVDPDQIHLTATVSVKGWVVNNLTPVV